MHKTLFNLVSGLVKKILNRIASETILVDRLLQRFQILNPVSKLFDTDCFTSSLNPIKIFQKWDTIAITVARQDRWCIVDQTKLTYVYHVIGMFIPQTHY